MGVKIMNHIGNQEVSHLLKPIALTAAACAATTLAGIYTLKATLLKKSPYPSLEQTIALTLYAAASGASCKFFSLNYGPKKAIIGPIMVLVLAIWTHLWWGFAKAIDRAKRSPY